MPERRACPRVPRAGVDPIDDPGTALALVRATMASPMRHETMAVLLDDRRRGVAVFTVDRTTRPDAVLEVTEVVCHTATYGDLRGHLGALILVSVRPGEGERFDDLDRWIEVSSRCDEVGIDLVEWFVVGDAVSCPRTLLGAPARWGTPTWSGPRPER